MRLTIEKSVIVDVLAKVQGITGRRSNLAITTNVILAAGEDRLSISATDLETGFEGTYPAKVEHDGKVALNARKLYEILRDFPSPEIHLNEIENGWIEIRSDNVEYHLVGMNTEDFPEIPKIDDVSFFEVDAKVLGVMIDRMTMISASDDKRAHVIGVYIEKIEGEDGQKRLRMVSTDGSRLGKTDYDAPEGMNIPLAEPVLVPKKGLVEVGRFLDALGSVEIGFKDNHFVLRRDGETLVIRLLEGDFPKYGDIIESLQGYRIVLDRQPFLMMLKRMSIMASESYRAVVFHFSENHLMIRSTNPDIGESKEDMEIEYEGDDIEVAFNPRFFIETLNAIDEDKVSLTMISEEKPCLISAVQDQGFLSVIMPMRL